MEIGIVGYGNLGKACERLLQNNRNKRLKCIFSRRKGIVSEFNTPIYGMDDLDGFVGKLDALCLLTGSQSDLIPLAKKVLGKFNTIDSFDTHAKMREYFSFADEAAKRGGTLSLIGIGWDPGLFSLMRGLNNAVLPLGYDATFWGRGVSQGHSEAIRKLDGVLDAKEYTFPISGAEERIKKGEKLTEREMHGRECFVVVKDGADKDKIEKEIKTMPNYFLPYDTTVHFIDKAEFDKNHSEMPHGGKVLRVGNTSGYAQNMEFSLKLNSNPYFTASVIVAYLTALNNMYSAGERGARTILDVAISALYNGDVLKFV